MNKDYFERILSERFGDPIGSYAGEPAVGVRDESLVCSKCGMMPVDGKCACKDSDVCPMCGMMPPQIDKPCTCNLKEEKQMCEVCGMSEAMCECGMNESDISEKQHYRNLSKSDAKERLSAIKKKYGTDWEDMKKAFSWAKKPDAALGALEDKAGVR